MQFLDAYETALNILSKYDAVVTDEVAASIQEELATHLAAVEADKLSSAELQA